MIRLLSQKYQKAGALLLYVLFCIETLMAVPAYSTNLSYAGYRPAPRPLSSVSENEDLVLLPGLLANEIQNGNNTEAFKRAGSGPPGKAEEGPGPGQPEMATFQSVNTSNMVDLFTGSFSYNIPLLDVGGYGVNIHYTGDISMDQDASWVGLGWNINPGTITRNMRGIPDDFNGYDSVTRIQHVKPNRTVGAAVSGDLEVLGLPKSLSATLGLFRNSYMGYGIETGLNVAINAGSKNSGGKTDNLSASDGGALKLSFSNNSQTGIDISPSLSFNLGKEDGLLHGSSTLQTNFNSRTGISSLQLHTQTRTAADDENKSRNLQQLATTMGIPDVVALSFATPSYIPTINMPYTGSQFSLTFKGGGAWWTVHPNVFIRGYVSQQEIKPEDSRQSLPAYGYLYFSQSDRKADALTDVNREKETHFNAATSPMIAVPQYTYDLYSISGEGTGGMFRAYRGDVGFVGDHAMKTKSNSFNASVDLGAGTIGHGGVDFTPVIANTQTRVWDDNNNNSIHNKIRFQHSDSIYRAVYFRNPGEKTSNTKEYYQQVGDENLMRVKLGGDKANIRALNTFSFIKNARNAGELPVDKPIVKSNRDKQTQVINYLTAQEASVLGLDKQIKSYGENSIPVGDCEDQIEYIDRYDSIVRKKHHLSEIDVINTDGRRYIYGLPVYNIQQKEVTFSVNQETNPDNLQNGLVNYEVGIDNSIHNNKGREGYFTKDSLPGFAHSFLLTGILSPDYVDVKGDGITPDDIGDAIKFNYSRIYGPANNYFDWRTPFQENMANYNEGLKTYNRDDKGTYLYGKKELWYLNSIESKTMIAVFKVSEDRKDSKAVKGENGGINASKGNRKLERIDLFSKADLIENGSNARPIKSVHFEYSYRLTPGGAVSNIDTGKLTLESLWFSYNGNDKGIQNPYVFSYSPDENGDLKEEFNPGYNPRHYDRWGNFKDSKDNPGNMSNVDYPYSIQDSIHAAANATAWHLTDIQLPSSGKIKITYESDDYAYVQNKRASQLFQIAGFSPSPGTAPTNKIYNSGPTPEDYDYIFINSAIPVDNVSEIKWKYLGNNDTVYFKIAVRMPADKWGNGYEFVPGYAVVQEVGLTAGKSDQFWLRLKKVDGENPVTRAALEYLRLNLPSKAYPGSETGDNFDLASAVKMLASGVSEIFNLLKGFNTAAKTKGYCRDIDVERSFVRLTNPRFKKYGGGTRVKKVEIFDNWNKMTQQTEASYGREYSYITTEELNGEQITISSGVATYEPNIGNDENPFRQPVAYAEKLAPLAPVDHLFVEEPVGESFFPSPSVGYSRVLIRTINRKAKSADGWSETTFYTSKDFPTLVDYTVLDDQSKKSYKPALNGLLKINAKNFITLSQGFRIELNDMNGKMKSQANYAETDSLHPVQASYYYYNVDDSKTYGKTLNNVVPVVDSANGNIDQTGIIGKDIELMVDMREQTSTTFSKQISDNVDVIPFFLPPVLPIFTGWPFPQKEETRFRSVASVKVIHKYGILDSVVVIDKGSVVSTKNLVYDGKTGEAILSRTNNEFDDPVYNFNYPAYWAYSGMGPASENLGFIYHNKKLQIVNGRMLYDGGNKFPVEKYFESGDELWVHSTGSIPADPGCTAYNSDTTVSFKKLWIIDAAKGRENNHSLWLIDATGKAYTGVLDSLKIVRSGKRNLLQAGAGNIVSLENPVKEVSPGKFKILIDETLRTLQAGTVTYNDQWQVENAFYQKDTSKLVTRIDTTEVPLTVTNFKRFNPIKQMSGFATNPYDTYVTNSAFLVASYEHVNDLSGGLFSGTICNSMTLATKSIINLDLSFAKEGDEILEASLPLTSKVPNYYWDVFVNTRGDCEGQRKSYDWSTATDYYFYFTSPNINGAIKSAIRRIKTDWNLTVWLTESSYDSQFSADSSQNVNVDENAIYQPLDLKNLVQSMVDSGNYGLVFEPTLQVDGFDAGEYAMYYLSFCSKDESGVNCPGGPGTFLTPLGTGGIASSDVVRSPLKMVSCDCTTPRIKIVYRHQVDSAFTVCRPYISDSIVNPYRWGMLGNWRTDTAFVYYGDRTEDDASVLQTDIRKEGTFKNFTPYWEMTESGIVANPDTAKWVWNHAISGYNRKGFEVEDFDALGRYNSGLYGYHQTLPVMAAQNSRYRQILFDGFEDYNFNIGKCQTCPTPREYNFAADTAQVAITDSESHTGIYSLRVKSGRHSTLTVPVVTKGEADSGRSLGVKIDSVPIVDVQIYGKGKGLLGTYSSINCTEYQPSKVDTTIDFNWGNEPPHPMLCEDYDVLWEGKLQVPVTGEFTFTGLSDFFMVMTLDDATVLDYSHSYGKVFLEAGKLYTINVAYYHTAYSNPSSVHLYWQGPGVSYQIVPKKYLYPKVQAGMPPVDTTGSVVTTIQKWCTNMEGVKHDHMIRPKFSPVQNDHLVMSAWVKIDDPNCNTLPSPDSVVIYSFPQVPGDNDPVAEVSLHKTGVKIEGWQRYEADVQVPAGKKKFSITIKAPGDYDIFLDDIKVESFNGNSKSYVYDPVSLRLMAELDVNNFATFYEYDDDGTLIRVKKETERGIMTVQETRSALLKDE